MAASKKGRRDLKRQRHWSGGLASDLVSEILSKLSSSGDQVRFAAVTPSWKQQPAADKIESRRHPPWLMLPGVTKGEDSGYRYVYSLSERKFYRIHIPRILRRHLCVGSGPGWIATVDPSNLELQLLHLPGGSVTRLPSITTFSDVDAGVLDRRGRLAGYMIRREMRLYPECYPGISSICRLGRGSFSFNPLKRMNSFYKKVIFFPSASIVFVIYNFPCCLAFARIGDESWTEFDMGCSCITDMSSSLGPRKDGVREFLTGMLVDVMCHKGQFYAAVKSGWILALDLLCSPPRFKCLDLRPPPIRWKNYSPVTIYLVESPDGAELMLVLRYADILSVLEFFTVFKCNLSNDNDEQPFRKEEEVAECEWVEVKCLGELVLFVGANLSLALHAKDFPELTPNSIYFTESELPPVKMISPADMGVFHMESGTAKPLPLPKVGNSMLRRIEWPLPVWIPHSNCFPLGTELDMVGELRKRRNAKNSRRRLKSSQREETKYDDKKTELTKRWPILYSEIKKAREVDALPHLGDCDQKVRASGHL